MIRILRLGNSSDRALDIAEGARAHEIVERMLAEASGEEVETILRPIWPTTQLPDLISKWMDEYQPDLVFLRVNNVWYNSESIPLRIQRKFGRVGTGVGNATERATKRRWVNQSPIYKRLRKLALLTVGYDLHFTTDEVLERMDECLRRIVAHEHVGVVVRGTIGKKEKNDKLPKRIAQQHDLRRTIVDDGLREICDRLHVTYLSRAIRDPARLDPAIRGSDGIHPGERGHQLAGQDEGAAIVAEWRRLHVTESVR